MKLEYKDELNAITKEIKITDNIISEFFKCKGIPDSLLEFYSKDSLESDEEFKDWLIERYVLPEYQKEILDIFYSAVRDLLREVVSKKIWNDEEKIKTTLINIQISKKYSEKLKIDWKHLHEFFLGQFIKGQCIVGPAEDYYEKLAKK